MPIITLTIPAGTFSPERKDAVAAQLTDILMEIEGTKGNPTFAAATWLLLNETPTNTIAVGGKFAPGGAHVNIDVPEGALTLAQKEALIAQTTDALLKAQDVEPDATQRARVYCLINEISDGGWGFAGQALTRARIAALRQQTLQSQS